MVHLSQVTDLCEHEAALPVSPPAEIEPVSRITSTLTPGAVVTTSKNDVDRIVTEYGIARPPYNESLKEIFKKKAEAEAAKKK